MDRSCHSGHHLSAKTKRHPHKALSLTILVR
jgi:hypothetical protein